MSVYIIRIKTGGVWDLEDPDGKTVLSDQSLPVTIPDDVNDHAVSNELDKHGVPDDHTKSPNYRNIHRGVKAVQTISYQTVDER